ncbi:Vacuolar protein sorting-associated protein 53 [Monosporozyma unispora]|nr:Vacuolar protein sorting-associated protein 53 [Kazachstania unispora]
MRLATFDYHPLDDITSIFLDNTSLENIDQLLSTTSEYKHHLETDIKQNEGASTIDNNSAEVSELSIFNHVLETFNETKKRAEGTQFTITTLTEGLSHLDNAKHNLTHTLTFCQNFRILVDSYFECKNLLQKSAYLEMVSPYKIMCSLTDNTFNAFKSVEGINKLLTSIWHLKSTIISNVRKLYAQVLDNKVQPSETLEKQLREGACELLDSESKTKIEMIDWVLSKLLYEIKEIFQLDDEAGSLENLSRRYMFFKKLLNNFNSKYASYFLPSWDMPLQLTNKFYQLTRTDLKVLLRKELKGKEPSIDLFMQALQVTLDFEKYIDVRFSNKCKEEKLSKLFEPYLSLWVSHQDRMMENKLLSYMSEAKLPVNTSDSLVVPSSADLFRTYRTILAETLELIGDSKNETILISLAEFFADWLIDYLNKVLKPLHVSEPSNTNEQQDIVKYIVLLVNTCDYCSTTIDQLEEKLSVFSSNSRGVAEPFMKAKDLYDEQLSKSNSLLLKRAVRMDLSFATKEFDNTDWTHIHVEDYSRYMVTLKKVLTFSESSSGSIGNVPLYKSALQEIISLLNRDVYKWNFFDNFVDSLTSTYVECVVRLLQPIPPFASIAKNRTLTTNQVVSIGEQLLLDIELLRSTLSTLNENIIGINANSSPSFKRSQKHIDKNLEQLLSFFKLLVAPLDSAEDYTAIYTRLTSNNKNSLVWAFTFSIKGAPWEISIWKKYWKSFQQGTETGEGGENDLFVFRWDSKHVTRFGTNLRRVQDPIWSKFINSDLGLAFKK